MFNLRMMSVGILLLSAPCIAENKLMESYEVFFSDQVPLSESFITLIQKEQKSIRLATYCLRHSGIVKALIEAKKRGVDVEVVVDPYSVKARSAVNRLPEKKIPLYVWKQPSESPKKKANMREAFCVFGGTKVWTGSVNFPVDKGEGNCENAIILDNSQLAKQFLEEFEQLKQKSLTYAEFSK